MAREDQIKALIGEYEDPHTGQTLAEAQAVQAVEISANDIVLHITLGYPGNGFQGTLEQDLRNLLADECQERVSVRLDHMVKTHSVQGNLKPLPGVKNIIAVASGKGGVGKSTTAVNLAIALAKEGARAGILDADIYGPSIPLMMGLSESRPETPDGTNIQPLHAHGVDCMSIGFLIDAEQPMVWRGPMVTQALNQLLGSTLWQDLDYLLVDMPPGTGDIQLTLAQRVPVSGAVIVTTPQDIALADARKGLQMFRKVKVPVLGIVENMSIHVCSQCGHQEAIFGSDGGDTLAEQYDVPLLGRLPLSKEIRVQADSGGPTVAVSPDSDTGLIYREVARNMAAQLSRSSKDYARLFPNIVVEDS